MSSCHNCKQKGHKAAACHLPTNLVCFLCKQIGHKSGACPRRQAEFAIEQNAGVGNDVARDPRAPKLARQAREPRQAAAAANGRQDDEKVKVVLQLDGMWGRNSAKVHMECALGRLKRLTVAAIPHINDDPQNAQPHIDIKGNANMYTELNNKLLTYGFRDIHFRKCTIELEIARGFHYTLAYRSHGIKAALGEILPLMSAVWTAWVADVRNNPDNVAAAALLAQQQQQQHHPVAAAAAGFVQTAPQIAHEAVAAVASRTAALEMGECPIGLTLMTDPTLILPCTHTFCGSNLKPMLERGINKCPLCNGPIASTAPNFALRDVLVALSKQ